MHGLDELVRKHRELDLLITNKGASSFISDWNCVHPFYKEYFLNNTPTLDEIQEYNYIRSDLELNNLILEFHKKKEDKTYVENELIISAGSSTIISSFFIWLSMKGIKSIYYIPPIYFTFRFFSKIYGIDLRPITKSQLFERDVKFNLPKSKSFLLLTDPVWYAGSAVDKVIIDKLYGWQQETASTIFVDGSFQNFKWGDTSAEHTSKLKKDSTFRLICPAKALATHGMRFSYLLLPSNEYDSYDFILDNIVGSSNIYDILFAKSCMKQLLSKNSNLELIKYTEEIYKALINNKLIETNVIPNCGYFVYAKIVNSQLSAITMDGGYFEQTNKAYADYVRINLLSSGIKNYLYPTR